MTSPTVATGQVVTTQADAVTYGFLGWNPETAAQRVRHHVRNGGDGTAAVAYVTETAYAVGKSVTYLGVQYVVVTAVLIANTTAPDTNVKFHPVKDHRGLGELTSSTVAAPQYVPA